MCACVRPACDLRATCVHLRATCVHLRAPACDLRETCVRLRAPACTCVLAGVCFFLYKKGVFFEFGAKKKTKTAFYRTIAVFWGFCAFPARILPFAFSTDFWLEFGFWPEFARFWVLAQFCSNLGFGPECARIWVLAPNVCVTSSGRHSEIILWL